MMHNPFLGTSKCIFGIWIEKGITTKHHLLLIDELASKFTVPRNIGRLPINMSSNYASFKLLPSDACFLNTIIIIINIRIIKIIAFTFLGVQISPLYFPYYYQKN